MMFSELIDDYGKIKIPEAYKWVVLKEKEAELLVHQVVYECLNGTTDVFVRLDNNDMLCHFLREYKERGAFSGPLKFESDEEESCLFCAFDLPKVHETLETMATFFGTINFSAIEAAHDDSNVVISDSRAKELSSSIQKFKKMNETTKKD